ncbi:alpha-hydroxy acid oxidase [Streptomyces tendae]
MRNIESKIQSWDDARYFARRRMPEFLYRMFENGTGAAVTQRDYASVYGQIGFMPRAAVEFKERVQSTTLLGHPIDLPVVLQPVGGLRLGRPGEGEVAAARAAGAAGTITTISSFSNYPIEDITAAATGPVFYQLFFLGGRSNTERIIRRAKAAGCAALVVTVDIAAPAVPRERPYRERIYTPGGMGVREAIRTAPQMLGALSWFRDFARDGFPGQVPMFLGDDGRPLDIVPAVHRQLEQIPTWDDLKWIREVWDGPLVLKGILTVEDAVRARDEGVEAIVVSNHGGNHLDNGVPSIEMLPRIAEAVGSDLEIVLDGGVRRGTDVVKALALGARAVGIGRGYVFPLFAAGEQGVRHILGMYRTEIDHTLASLGCGNVADLDGSYVRVPSAWSASRDSDRS